MRGAVLDAGLSIERFCLKFYAESSGAVDLAQAIPVFNRWIQHGRLPGLLIDVVDYRHVPDGPGVVLIGHEADYFLDLAEGPLGLLYNRKRLGAGSNVERLRLALASALQACRLLEGEPEFRSFGLRFEGGKLRFILNDRAVAANDDRTLELVRADLEPVLATLYPGEAVRIERDTSDPRSRLTLDVTSGASLDVETLLDRLG